MEGGKLGFFRIFLDKSWKETKSCFEHSIQALFRIGKQTLNQSAVNDSLGMINNSISLEG